MSKGGPNQQLRTATWQAIRDNPGLTSHELGFIVRKYWRERELDPGRFAPRDVTAVLKREGHLRAEPTDGGANRWWVDYPRARAVVLRTERDELEQWNRQHGQTPPIRSRRTDGG